MADDDNNSDDERHRRKKPVGTPEWSETCVGIWIKKSKGNSGKKDDVKQTCRGISILHLNKYADPKKVKNIPTQGIEIVIREDKVSTLHNLHPFLGIFVDEQDTTSRGKSIGSQDQKSAGDKESDSHSEESTPKILQKVVENWRNRCHDAGQKVTKYYEDPKSSTEIITDVKNGMLKSCETTVRILSYCHPQDKAKQISSFITARLKDLSKWWKE